MTSNKYRTALALALGATFTMTTIPAATAADVLSATPQTIAGATLEYTAATASSPLGVSPDIYFDDTTGIYYLYTTGSPATTYTSTDGSNWTVAAGAKLPNGGFDWSVVKMGPNNYRMYFASMTNKAGLVSCATKMKSLFYATSTDLLTWTAQPSSLVEDVGCGVPHVLRKPDGTFLLYYNTLSSELTVMKIASSQDGLSFTQVGVVNDCNLGDPAPLVMPDGTYLMISTAVCKTAQTAQISSSPNGIDWTRRSSALLTLANAAVVDPSIELVNGKLRVWFAYAAGGGHDKAVIVTGALTLGAAATTTTTTTAATTTTTATTNQATTNKPGTTCNKSAAKAQFQGKTVVCKKTKGKLIWVQQK